MRQDIRVANAKKPFKSNWKAYFPISTIFKFIGQTNIILHQSRLYDVINMLSTLTLMSEVPKIKTGTPSC